MTKIQKILIIRIIEWAQKHNIKIEDLTSQQIKMALKQSR